MNYSNAGAHALSHPNANEWRRQNDKTETDNSVNLSSFQIVIYDYASASSSVQSTVMNIDNVCDTFLSSWLHAILVTA